MEVLSLRERNYASWMLQRTSMQLKKAILRSWRLHRKVKVILYSIRFRDSNARGESNGGSGGKMLRNPIQRDLSVAIMKTPTKAEAAYKCI